jgi:hypothetical protein
MSALPLCRTQISLQFPDLGRQEVDEVLLAVLSEHIRQMANERCGA